jgi:hypothetical protein
MADLPTDHVVTALITNIRSNLEEALSIVKAAESCAVDGNTNRSIQVLMDFEIFLHESQDLFRAALAIKRNFLTEIA